MTGGSIRSTLYPCVHTTPARTSGRRSCAFSRRPHARALRSRRPAGPPSVACAAPSVRTVVIIGVPFLGLSAGVMGLQALGKVRYLIHPRSRTSDYIHVGRIKEGERQAAVVLAKSGVVDQLFVMGSLAVESVVLMKRELKPTGSVYMQLWDVRLAG